MITETLTPRAVESFLVRTAFQQFEYQEPMYHGMARMRPMFGRPFPRDRFEVLSAVAAFSYHWLRALGLRSCPVASQR